MSLPHNGDVADALLRRLLVAVAACQRRTLALCHLHRPPMAAVVVASSSAASSAGQPAAGPAPAGNLLFFCSNEMRVAVPDLYRGACQEQHQGGNEARRPRRTLTPACSLQRHGWRCLGWMAWAARVNHEPLGSVSRRACQTLRNGRMRLMQLRAVPLAAATGHMPPGGTVYLLHEECY